MAESTSQRSDWLARVLAVTMQGPLPLFLILAAFVGGIVALMITPREEEPQIIVPLADVLVAAPGLSAQQVERQIATPLEKLLHQIDGVPVYLGDVARVIDGPAEPVSYTWMGFGPASNMKNAYPDVYPAVAISIAKKKGANAAWVAREVEDYFAKLKRDIFPPEV